MITEATRVLITGPPCSGKTTLAGKLASQHHAPVADFDAIAVRMGSPDPYTHPDHIAASAANEYDRLLTQSGDLVAIRCAPSRGARYAIARKMRATEVIVLAVTADECMARARRDSRPERTAEVIDWWWRTYQMASHDTVISSEGVPPGGTFNW